MPSALVACPGGSSSAPRHKGPAAVSGAAAALNTASGVPRRQPEPTQVDHDVSWREQALELPRDRVSAAEGHDLGLECRPPRLGVRVPPLPDRSGAAGGESVVRVRFESGASRFEVVSWRRRKAPRPELPGYLRRVFATDRETVAFAARATPRGGTRAAVNIGELVPMKAGRWLGGSTVSPRVCLPGISR